VPQSVEQNEEQPVRIKIYHKKIQKLKTMKSIKFKNDLQESYDSEEFGKKKITTEKMLIRTKTLANLRIRKKSSIKNDDGKEEFLLKKCPTNKYDYLSKVSTFNTIIKSQIIRGGDDKNEYTNMINSQNLIQEVEQEDDDNDIDSVICTNKMFSFEEEQKLKEIFSSHYLFQDFDEQMLGYIIEDLIEFNLQKGRVLFEEGEDGNYFYILKSGHLELLEKGVQKKILGEWECFGDLSLLQKCKRSCTIRALVDSELYVLEGYIFREIIKNLNRAKMVDILKHIDNITILQNLDSIQKNNIATLAVQMKFEKGEKIITKGEVGDKMYIIKEGSFSCRSGNKEVKKLTANDFFGENSLLFESKRSLDVFSVEKSICYIITKKNLEEALGHSYQDIILFSFFKSAVMDNNLIMSLFTELQLDDLYKIFEIKKYKSNEVIYPKEQNLNKKLVIIFQGNLAEVK
jgi:CRP-like cAMP-binding protein